MDFFIFLPVVAHASACSQVFEQEGPEKPETIPGDVIFKITTAPHSHFTRKGNDLLYALSLALSFSGRQIFFPDDVSL